MPSPSNNPRQLVLPFGNDAGNVRRPAKLFCVYCDKPALTRDHVPPKSLLQRPYPANLRTVPACTGCNNGYAKDEQYLAVLLAHISPHDHLQAKLDPGGSINRALETAPSLDDRLINSIEVDEHGSPYIRPELERIARITTKIAFGLYCLQYGHRHSPTRFRTRWVGPAEAAIPTSLVAAQFNWPGIRRKRWTTVQPDAFSFLFAKGWLATDPALYCFLDLHKTLTAVIDCPAPAPAKNRSLPMRRPWK